MTSLPSPSRSRLGGGWVLALSLVLVLPAGAQTPPKKPPQKPVLLPQAFQPNVSNTAETTTVGDNPNFFSPWYDVMDELRLPDTFDVQEAAAAAAVGLAETAADAMNDPAVAAGSTPLSDLPIEDSGGALLGYPEGTAFNADSLLLTPGGGGYASLSKEASLPYGTAVYPMEYSPRAIPVFQRVQELTRIGPFRIGADISGSVAHNDNVFGDQTDPKSDQIATFQPLFFLEAGTRGALRLLYAPTYVTFAKYKELSTVNQALYLQIRYPFTKLKIGIDASYLSQNGLFIDSDGFVQQNTALVRLFGEYPLTQKLMSSFTLENIRQEAIPGGTNIENSVHLRLIHQVTRAFNAGASFKVGTLSAPAESQTYEAAQVTFSYNPTVALRFAAEFGMEMRSLSFTSGGQTILPISVFNFQAVYNPSSNAIYTLGFFRNALNTTFNNVSLNITTGVSVSAVARVAGKLNVRLELVAGRTEQYADEEGEDGTFSFVQGGITLSYPIMKSVEIQIFDNLQQRLQSTIGSDYVSNTLGMGLSVKF